MNREQMIEKAAEQVRQQNAMETKPTVYDLAEAVLDAVLPRVSTVAELEALSTGSRLIDANGDGYRPSAPGYLVSDSGTLLRVENALTPLTVVWQPEN